MCAEGFGLVDRIVRGGGGCGIEQQGLTFPVEEAPTRADKEDDVIRTVQAIM